MRIVLALTGTGEREMGSGGEGVRMSPELEALLAPLVEAAKAGEDVQPHLDALREQMLQDNPDQAEAIEQLLSDLAANLPTGDEES